MGRYHERSCRRLLGHKLDFLQDLFTFVTPRRGIDASIALERRIIAARTKRMSVLHGEPAHLILVGAGARGTSPQSDAQLSASMAYVQLLLWEPSRSLGDIEHVGWDSLLQVYFCARKLGSLPRCRYKRSSGLSPSCAGSRWLTTEMMTSRPIS